MTPLPLSLGVSQRRTPMTFPLAFVGILFAAALLLGGYAARLNRELRRLVPPAVADRWRADLLAARSQPWPLYRRAKLLAFPPHWHRELHAARGVALVERFYLAVIGAFVLAVLGLSLLRALFPAG